MSLIAGKDAFGTQFKRLGIVIGNVTDISGPERSREAYDVTAHDSPNQYREFIPGLKDGGEITLTINYDPGNTSQALLDTDFESQTVQTNYSLVVLPGLADEVIWDFDGFVTGLSDAFPHDDKMERNVTIKITGKPVLVLAGT